MEKILPINAKPFLSSYSSHAKFMAMTTADKNYEQWFYSNYIQLISKKNFNEVHDVPLDFFIDIKRDNCYYYNNPILYIQCLKLELLNVLCQDIVEFIMNAIDKNYYVDICLNEYFIPIKRAYNKFDCPHDNLIYGYDKKKSIFYVAGYIQKFDDLFVGTYGVFQITFNELYAAYKNCPYLEWYKSIYLYSAESHGGTTEKYIFDIKMMKNSLESYLHCENSLHNYSNVQPRTIRFSFGFDVYKDLLNNLDMGYYSNDIRPLGLLVEHKKCMANRIKYLHQNNYLIKSEYALLDTYISEIYKCTLKARNLQLKYMIRGDTE